MNKTLCEIFGVDQTATITTSATDFTTVSKEMNELIKQGKDCLSTLMYKIETSADTEDIDCFANIMCQINNVLKEYNKFALLEMKQVHKKEQIQLIDKLEKEKNTYNLDKQLVPFSLDAVLTALDKK